MKRGLIYILLFLMASGTAYSQPFKFYYSNHPKVLKSNNDTMLYPFVGGMNAPQFSNIDLNGDGVKDLFVFDRAPAANGHTTLTFLHTPTGYVYAPQYEMCFPEMNSWVTLKDYNGDGKEDIFTEITREKSQLVDTSQLLFGGMRVLRNEFGTGGLKFKQVSNVVMDTGGWYVQVGEPKAPAPVGFNRGDISGIEDLDGDGDIDIVAFNGFNNTPLFYENWTINPQGVVYHPDTIKYVFRDACWGYIQYDINSQRNQFKIGQENPDGCYQLYGKNEMHASSSIAMVDMNNDGIKDMIYGDGSFNNLIYMINGRHANSLGRDSISFQDTVFPPNTTPARFIIYPSSFYVDIDNDGLKELLVTTNNALNAQNRNNVWIYENNGTNTQPVFNYQGNNFFINEESIDLGGRSVPVLVDIDQDGDKDLVIATNGDYAQTQNYDDRMVLYKNIGTDPLQPVFQLADTNFLMTSLDSVIINLHPAFGDLNGDGKDDLIIGDVYGYLQYYLNTSTAGNYTFSLQSRKYANIMVRGYAAPQIVDLNKDGKLDLVVGTKQGIVQYFENTGTTTSPSFSSVPTIDSLGKIFVNRVDVLPQGYADTSLTGYATPHVCDLDNDGNYEMLVGCESGYIYLYTGVTTTPGVAFKRYDNLFVSDSSQQTTYKLVFGYRSAPFTGYLDNDGKPDLLIGNMRGGINLYASTSRDIHIGIDQLDRASSKIVLYPNPAQQFITVTTESIKENLVYEVYNEIGQRMDAGKMNTYESSKTLSIQQYSPGIYFMVFKGDNGYSGAKRFVVTK